MQFLIDAQLPYRLKTWLLSSGFDALHTSDLPKQNLTEDYEIAHIADAQIRIVITKDSDFLKLKILQNIPQKLLLITTGNIGNKELLALFERNFATAIQLFTSFDVVEINNSFVIGHSFE
jgi:predicted nuclease of predicted toxin-antitoxin system